MSVVSFSEFKEHRARRRTEALMLGDLTPRDDTREHHGAGHDEKENMNQAPYCEGTDGSEESEHDEDQGG